MALEYVLMYSGVCVMNELIVRYAGAGVVLILGVIAWLVIWHDIQKGRKQ